jgi:hypothetical protein
MAKFPWGERSFQVPEAVLLGLAWSVAVIGYTLGRYGPQGALDSFPSAGDLRGVVLVNVGFVCVWYVIIGTPIIVNGIRPVPMANKKEEPQCFLMALFYYDAPAEIKADAYHIGARGIANTMEQGIPFLLLIWLHAIFVNPITSVPLGWSFVIARFFYPYFYGMYGQMNNMVQISQWICYTVNGYFTCALFYKCHYGKDLHTQMDASGPAMVYASAMFGGMLITVLFLVFPVPGAKVITRGVVWNQAQGSAQE